MILKNKLHITHCPIFYQPPEDKRQETKEFTTEPLDGGDTQFKQLLYISDISQYGFNNYYDVQ